MDSIICPNLPKCVDEIRRVFNQFASQDDNNREAVSKKELAMLLRREITPLTESAVDHTKLLDFIQDLEQKSDEKLTFTEYMLCLASFTCVWMGRTFRSPRTRGIDL